MWKKLSLYLQLMRFPLVFTAMADISCGYLVLNGGEFSMTVFFLLLAVTAGFYTGGMVLNDIADIKRDGQLWPERPLPTGQVSYLEAWILFLFLAGGALALSFFLPGHRWIFALLTLAAIGSYDFLLKSSALLGPLAMAACRFFNFTLGAGEWTWMAGIVALYIVHLTWVSLLEEEWKQYRQKLFVLPVGLGILLLSATFFMDQWSWWVGGLAPLVRLLGWITYRLKRAENPRQIGLCVRDLILGVVLLDGAILLGMGREEGLFIWLWLLPAWGAMKVNEWMKAKRK